MARDRLCGKAVLLVGLLTASSAALDGPLTIDPGRIGWHAAGKQGVVASGKPEAVAAGLELLAEGGNAADAAVATILALSVTDYGLFAIGAEVPFMIYLAPRREALVLNGMGGAPLDPEAIRWYLEHGVPTSGIRAAAVPSALSTCFAALKLFGTVSFERVAQPVLRLLDRGGEPWHPDLARTLRRLIARELETAGTREEKLQAARDRFYRGDIAEELDAWYREQGGFLRKTDLAAHETFVEAPTSAPYRGCLVLKCGPWTQGPFLCQALRLLDGFDLRAQGHLSVSQIHLAVESMKLALADRDTYYADPRQARVPLPELLSDAYTTLRRPLIDAGRASREVRPGDPVGLKALRGAGLLRPAPGGTTTCCVVDRWGNVVAATPSGNPPYLPPGKTGVTHATRLSSFNTDASHPNCIAPGKRPRITLTPTLVLRDGLPFLAVSVAGGDLQDQVTLNLVLDAVDFGLSPEKAVRVPRFATNHHENSFDPRPDRQKAFKEHGSLSIQASAPVELKEGLGKLGHVVHEVVGALGAPVLVRIDPRAGLAEAAGDPDAGRHAGAVDDFRP